MIYGNAFFPTAEASHEFKAPLTCLWAPCMWPLEEPVYFQLEVQGETIRNVSLTSGHVHRGMEAMAAKRNPCKEHHP